MRSETMHDSTHKVHDINDREGLQTDINSDTRMANQAVADVGQANSGGGLAQLGEAV